MKSRKILRLWSIVFLCSIPMCVIIYTQLRDWTHLKHIFTDRETNLAKRLIEVEQQNLFLRRQLNISKERLVSIMSKTQNESNVKLHEKRDYINSNVITNSSK